MLESEKVRKIIKVVGVSVSASLLMGITLVTLPLDKTVQAKAMPVTLQRLPLDTMKEESLSKEDRLTLVSEKLTVPQETQNAIDVIRKNKKIAEQKKQEELVQAEKARVQGLIKEEQQRKANEKKQHPPYEVTIGDAGGHSVIPGKTTRQKTYMSYKAITSRSSLQWKLQQHTNCWNDPLGFRRYDNHYMIAIGTGWGFNVGDKVVVSLDTGRKFSAVIGDFKSDMHTDATRRYKVNPSNPNASDVNVVEFLVVPKGQMIKHIRETGDMSYAKTKDMDAQMQGNVVNIQAY